MLRDSNFCWENSLPLQPKVRVSCTNTHAALKYSLGGCLCMRRSVGDERVWLEDQGRCFNKPDTHCLALHIIACLLLAYGGNWPKNKVEECVCVCLRLYKRSFTEVAEWKQRAWEYCCHTVFIFVFMSVFILALGFCHAVLCCAC